MMREDQYVTPPVKRTCNRTTVTLIFIVSASLSHSVRADVPTDIPITPEPVGSGARALGQSAFIAVADDATATSWNPAGLIQLEKPEASFVGAWKTIRTDPSSMTSDVSYDARDWSQGEINFMSYAQPITVANSDVVLSGNYHQVYDLGLEYRGAGMSAAMPVSMPMIVDSVSKGAIAAYSLAAGSSIPGCREITVGASFNWYTESLLNDYTRRLKTTQSVLRPDHTWFTTRTTETLDHFRGSNFTVGFLADVYEEEENLLTLGFVYHTPFTAKVDQEVIKFNPSRDPNTWAESGRLDIDFPLSLGVGANYRFSDRFSGAIDLQWTDWSQYTYTDADSTPSDTLAVRLGFERLWFDEPSKESAFAWRGGVFYEPRPAWDDVLPVYGFSMGLGWTLKDQFSLDFAYQFRWGEADDFALGLTHFDYGIEEHFFVTSLITYF